MFGDDFYPTPAMLARDMLSGIDFRMISSVLEPSAGKGNIVDIVADKFRYSHSSYSKVVNWDIDTIELDQNLRYILKGKNYRVVHDDFLTYHSFKRYDLIVMNPPFSAGDKHLLKALEMQQNGGQIVCILNAETLRNPYNNIRKDLLFQLEKYNADIRYMDHAFIGAERSTIVEIALIKVSIPRSQDDSIILTELKKNELHHSDSAYQESYHMINGDFIKGIIDQYNYEINAGLKLISEYNSIKPLMLKSFKENASEAVLELSLKDKDEDNNCSLENSYIKQIRMKYWNALFTSDQFMGLFTSNLREKYISKITELRNYDFSLYNIYTIKIQLNQEMVKGVEDTILKLFEEFSHKHHWYDEMSKNIHYYNGWKTNKAWKINKRIIIPLSAYSSWSGLRYGWDFESKIADIEKVFNYLDNGITPDIDLTQTLRDANDSKLTSKIKTKYFLFTVYKKGTTHIEFTNPELLHKFNLFGSQRLGFLPPSYGKVKYKDMTEEEKLVIDDFEGKESYAKVMDNLPYYVVDSSKLLMIAS